MDVHAMIQHTSIRITHIVAGAVLLTLLGSVAPANAQAPAPAPATESESKWSADFGIGWDNGITGNINSSAIGTLNNQVVVITKNSYNDVYGAGLHLRFGGGYMFRPDTEARVTFTFQSLDADFVTPMGDMGASNLYGQYTDYQTFGIDFGLRRYATLKPKFRAYGEGTLGIGFVDKTDVTLVAPGINYVSKVNDFYDQTAAFTFGINVGLDVQTGKNIGYFGQLGLRYVSGMTEIDDLEGTGLDTINDKSARWTLPFLVGIRYRF